MAHTNLTDLKNKFEDGDRPTGEDFANLLDSCHNTKLDTPVTVTGTLTVSGDSTFKSPVTFKDDVTHEKKLTVDGAALLKDSVIIYKNANINNDLIAGGATRLLGLLTVNNTATFEGNVNVRGDTVINSTLEVQQAQHNLGAMTIEGATLLTGPLTVHGLTTLNGTLSIDDNLTVHGLAIFDNQITGNAGTLITGDSVFMDNLHVKGDLRVDGNAYLEAGPSGEINVGDSSSDNVKFNADVASHILPNGHKQYNIGAPDNMWSNVYAGCFIAGKDVEVTGDIIVTGTVDGRDVSEDGEKIDNVVSTVSDTSASWDTAYVKSIANEQDLVVVSTASAGWDETQAIVTGSKDAWSDARTTVKAFSASWEESADIQAVADELAVVGTVSADWSDSRTTVSSNSATWNKTKLVEFVDVNPAGLSNNSILRYDDASSTWVASTTEDTKAAGSITVLDGNNSAWDDATVILKDNDAPANTVTFTGDRDVDYGNNTKVNNFSYTFGYAGVTSNHQSAQVLADVINFASANGDLAITAEAVNDIVNLSQDKAGAGGNTNITGGLLSMQLISVSDFTGGENPDAFEHLDDTPASYGGNSGKFVKVKSGEDGLEFVEDDTRTTVNTFSASWEESADIQAVADDVAIVGAVSGDWTDARTTLGTTSADWNDARTTLGTASGDWNDARTTLGTTSGDWNDARTTLGTTSGDWNDTRSSLMAASGDWNESQSVVNSTSADWNDARTTLGTASGDWNDARSSLQAASGDWNESQSVVNSTSADWNDTRSSLMAASGDWNDTRSSLMAASGDWNESQSVVNNTSADWNSVYSHINSVSGQGLATVDADGKLLVDQIPELSITRVHTANNPGDVEVLNPATGIQVGDVVVVMSTHDNIIALVDDPSGVYDNTTKDYTGYAKLAMPDGLVQTVNGKPGPGVVLNPDDFLDDSTAHKFVSQQNIDDWNDTRTTLGTASGDWNDTRSSLQATSGDWNDTRSTLSSVSGDWNDARSSLIAASGDWNESQSVVNSTSGDWNESQSVVNSTSADWSDTRSSVMSTSGDWNDTRASVMSTSGDWNSVYSFVNADSATNNTTYNDDTYVNVAGDTMTGNLNIDGGELVVGGNITMAGDLIHQNDTGTRISFNDDIISLETNGQEFITIDGTAPTPDAVIINDPASTAIHFRIKSVDTADALYVDGDTGRVGIGISDFGGLESMQCWVNQGLGVVGGFIVNGGNAEIGGAVVATSNIETAGHFVSAGENLLDIFSTDTDVHGDMTVHGSISAQDELTVSKFANVSGDMVVGGDLTSDGDFTGKTISSGGAYSTIDDTGQSVAGVTQDVNIGGHVLHIVNGLIVKVTDE